MGDAKIKRLNNRMKTSQTISNLCPLHRLGHLTTSKPKWKWLSFITRPPRRSPNLLIFLFKKQEFSGFFCQLRDSQYHTPLNDPLESSIPLRLIIKRLSVFCIIRTASSIRDSNKKIEETRPFVVCNIRTVCHISYVILQSATHKNTQYILLRVSPGGV